MKSKSWCWGRPEIDSFRVLSVFGSKGARQTRKSDFCDFCS
jgi:hypothetical protein